MKEMQIALRILALCLLVVGILGYLEIFRNVNVDSLRCWHCIADNCADDPSDNYKASEKLCNPGQSCQKVYFEMVEETDKGNVMHMSTVRGCSADCIERNDFLNCTEQLKTSRGCVRKDCCSDGNLCNSVNNTRMSTITLLCAVIISLCLFQTKHSFLRLIASGRM